MSVWLTPDGRPFYGGTYYPERRPPRHAVVHEGVRGRCAGLGRSARRRRGAGEQAHRGDRRDRARGRDRASGARRRDARAALPRTSAPSSIRAWGGFGRAPKFPQAMTLDFLCRAAGARPRTRDPRDDHHDARRDGRGRHPRPARRRLRPVLDRRDVARSPLREDAVRQRAAHRRVPARLPRDRRGAVPRAWSKTSSAMCSATSPIRPAGSTRPRTPTPKGSRASSTSGPSTRSARCAAHDADEVVRYYGVTANGNFVDPHTHYSGNILHAVDRTETPSEAVERGRAALFARRELRDPPRPRQQGAARLERTVPLGAHGGRGRARSRRLDGPRRVRTRPSC